MIFKALPVNVGDSFYLESNSKRILVDGGKNKTSIIKLLDKEKIPNKHFDVLICTHYDSDHINGILGILRSGKYSFKELWLPEILGSIGYTILEKPLAILEQLREVNIKDISSCSQETIESEILPDNLQTNEFSNKSIKTSSLEYLNNFFETDLDLVLHFAKNLSLNHSIQLKSIISILSSSHSSGSYIRWFKYKDDLLNKLINFNLYAQNCVQSYINLYSPPTFYYALHLSTINKNSLVFKYEENNLPNVLFTGDSDLSFCGSKKISLRDNSIVTAPHHGSENNDLAYSKIHGDKLFFVRSDQSQIKRPGKGFLSQINKYCTICRNKTPKSKVELTYNGSSFISSSNKCIC